MNYSIHHHAEEELEEIEKYYDDIRADLGNRFRDEIQLTISRILKRPLAWQELSPMIRRCRLTSCPYGVVYHVKPNAILILAVTHLHREPSYWMDRL
jgi:hypothetical protein